MQVGTLVKGNINGLLGIVTTLSVTSKIHVHVYWFTIGSNSTGWIRTDGLEVLCN